MKVFYKWLRNKLQSAEVQDKLSSQLVPIKESVYLKHVDMYGMNFTIHKANGGYVVQYNQYDKSTERSDTKLHIITDDKDLGEELGKIISFEILRG